MKTSAALYKTAYLLALITIGYNLLEGLFSTFLGYEDESLALFGFGVDSIIEVISGFGIARMVQRIRKNPDSSRDRFEKNALHITGYSFYILSAGLVITGIHNIITGRNPETTFWGVIISLISILAMLALIYGKRKVGHQLNSEAILADAACTKVCVYMSAVLLASSLLYEVTHIPYIDSLGTLGLAWFSFSEGKECFEKARQDKYCSCDVHPETGEVRE